VDLVGIQVNWNRGGGGAEPASDYTLLFYGNMNNNEIEVFLRCKGVITAVKRVQFDSDVSHIRSAV
jgi:hypothetical protein